MLIHELNEPGLVPLKSFQLELQKDASLKIDFVSDFTHNIREIKNGMHSPEDIYYLSKQLEPLPKFFLRYFAPDAFEYLESWYRGFNRLEAKLEMQYYSAAIDPGDVFRYLDKEILQK